MIQLVIFDMAGTTVDEQNIVYKTVQKAIQAKGFEVELDIVLKMAAGREKLNAIKSVLEYINASTEQAEEIFEDFKQRLKMAYIEEPIFPQPHAEATFKALQEKAIKVALNTGYDRPTVAQLLNRLNWTNHPHIDLTICASDVKHGRPAPDMIELAMKQLGVVDAKSVAKIGDSTVDIEEGHNAHCAYSIGITTGAQTREQLQTAHPTAIIDNLQELLAVMKL